MKNILSLAVLSLLSLSAPALADAATSDSTGAATVTAQLVSQAQATPPQVAGLAPAVPTPTEVPSAGQVDGGQVVQLVLQAVSSKNWALLACAVVLGAVWAVRRFLAPRVAWLSTDAAGVLLSVTGSVSLTLVGALKTGTPVTLSLVLGALFTAAGASGLYSWGRKLTASAKVQAQAKPAAS